MLQWSQLSSMRRAPHRRMWPMKVKMAEVEGQAEGSSAPCRKSICQFGIEIPDPALQEIEAAPLVAALSMVFGAKCAGSCQGPTRIALFSFS